VADALEFHRLHRGETRDRRLRRWVRLAALDRRLRAVARPETPFQESHG